MKNILNKIKAFGKETYAQVVRRSAIKSLTSGQNMSGQMRRSLLRATFIALPVDKADPRARTASLERRVAKSTHVQRCRWYARLFRRIALLDAKIKTAGGKQLDALTGQRKNLDTVRGVIGSFFARQGFEINQWQTRQRQQFLNR